ncbi:hypothetical protein LPB03_15775 [Polaribacter vadi]|uniref:Uncharacterized protein n=1 Tax=Polaribacter vadi TaxID=1774273 RepID=A0A1B8TNV2_9FLAO|nr:hypothetical protein LPB03_15775 [Polaribacter vadi]OBY61264.1 hypothetical protein LPB3_15725 [Polaribacter vadi]
MDEVSLFLMINFNFKISIDFVLFFDVSKCVRFFKFNGVDTVFVCFLFFNIQKESLFFVHATVVSLLKFKENVKILDDKVLHFNKNTSLFDFITWG